MEERGGEIIYKYKDSSYYLQAETEKEMQQWLWTIEYCKSNELTESTEASHVHLSPKTLLTDRFQSAIDTQHCLVAGSTSPLPSPIDQVLSPIVSTASSLTSLMIREGVPGIDKMGDEVSIKEQYSGNSVPSSWGMPWLATSIHALSSSSSNPGSSDESENAVEKPNALQLVVWPNKIEMDVHRPNLLNYTSSLEAKQRELRKIFANVPTSEVVLECKKNILKIRLMISNIYIYIYFFP